MMLMQDSPEKPTFGTFGLYRWLLASMVMLNHLGPNQYGYCGGRAVYAFFLLSGYIVSYILDTHYLHIHNGKFKFYLNRGLRIFPAYWLVMLATLPFAARFPDIAHSINGSLGVPQNSNDWLVNITVIGIDNIVGGLAPNTLVPPAWSLAVELIGWMLLAWVVGKKSALRNFIILAIAYRLFLIYLVRWIHFRSVALGFFSPLACLFCFALGTILHHRRKWGFKDIPLKTGRVVLLMPILIFVINIDFHICVLMNCITIYYLSGIETKRLPAWLQRLDKFMGDLAYPLFLVHMLLALIFLAYRPELHTNSWPLFWTVLPVANAVAILMHYGIELPVNKLRRVIKC